MESSTDSLSKNFNYLGAYLLDGLKPPPRMTIDEWADKNRYLPRVSSPEPGRWRTDRTPYLKEIMHELSPSSYAEEVIFMKGGQVGATEVGLNWLLYIMDINPAPTLYVQPTVDLCKRYSRQRVSPSIQECETLNGKVFENKSRDKSNTILQKDFPGGTLIMTGANSAAGLRSMPICNLIADEVDGWPQDADGEGDPLELAERRLANFARKKSLIISTPTIAGMSRIEAKFLLSDQRFYYVPCPYCKQMQIITWESLKFENRDPRTVRMICSKCAAEIYEYHKTEMLLRGEWIKHNSKSEIPGFHLSAFYSPLGWYSWKTAVKKRLESICEQMKAMVWKNTVSGETWDDSFTSIDAHWLKKREEQYEAEVPAGVLVLSAAIDTHDDRLECSVYGWGLDYESWLISHQVFMGSPGAPDVWGLVDQFLMKDFQHERGVPINIAAACVDSLGHHTDMVYSFCKARFFRRIFAIIGQGGAGKPLVISYNHHNRAGVYLFRLGVDQGKETLYTRFKIKEPGPGYCHFPKGLDEKFYQQLTSEKRIRRHNAGIPRLEWVLPSGRRNEALDCAVYAMAALTILNPNLAQLAKEKLIYKGTPAAPRVRRRIYSEGVKNG